MMDLKLYVKSLTSKYAPQQPRAHGIVILYTDIMQLSSTVFKPTEEIKCDLEVALAWGVSVYNSIKHVNGFSKFSDS